MGFTGSAATTVWFAYPGGAKPGRLTASSVSAMWSVLGESTASVSLPSKDANRFGTPDGIDVWLGKWMRWDSPLGVWGGIVTDATVGVRDRTTELTVTSMHRLLSTRRTPTTYRLASGPAGGLAIRAIQDAASDAEQWVSTYAADMDGPNLSVEWHGESVADVIGFVADAGGMEWDCSMGADWRVAFEMRPRLGRDLTGSVLLIEGREVHEATIRATLDGVANDVLAVANEDGWRKSRKRVAVDGDSIDRYGRIQATLPLTEVSSGQTLLQYARAELDRTAYPKVPLSIEMPARHRLCSLFRHGDTVRLWLPSAGIRCGFRVVSRACDTDTGIAVFSGDAVPLVA